jgi:hypothetical protein
MRHDISLQLRQIEHVDWHEAPEEACTCGIYALNYLGERGLDYHSGVSVVFGTVACWGKVIPGSRGARVEYAYPSELYVRHNALLRGYRADLIVERLGAYGVPIVVLPDDSPCPPPLAA